MGRCIPGCRTSRKVYKPQRLHSHLTGGARCDVTNLGSSTAWANLNDTRVPLPRSFRQTASPRTMDSGLVDPQLLNDSRNMCVVRWFFFHASARADSAATAVYPAVLRRPPRTPWSGSRVTVARLGYGADQGSQNAPLSAHLHVSKCSASTLASSKVGSGKVQYPLLPFLLTFTDILTLRRHHTMCALLRDAWHAANM